MKKIVKMKKKKCCNVCFLKQTPLTILKRTVPTGHLPDENARKPAHFPGPSPTR